MRVCVRRWLGGWVRACVRVLSICLEKEAVFGGLLTAVGSVATLVQLLHQLHLLLVKLHHLFLQQGAPPNDLLLAGLGLG